MRRILFAALFVAFPIFAFAQDKPAEPPAPAVAAAAESASLESIDTKSLDTNGDGKVSKEEIAAAVAAEPDVKDLLSGGSDVLEKGKLLGGLKGKDKTAVLTIIAGFLAALFKLLLSLIKLLGKNIAWFKTKDGKRVVKYSTLGLGALAGLAANLALGVSIPECVLIAMSGPLAVAIHEYTKDSKEAAA